MITNLLKEILLRNLLSFNLLFAQKRDKTIKIKTKNGNLNGNIGFGWILLTVSFILYSNSLFGGFIWDDRAAVV